jgi:predicted RNA-binding protein YlxR (DUF448 family)
MAQPTRAKHTPVRMCAVCREHANKRTLIRIVRTEHGVAVDPSGKLNGRGAYLCEQESCWERAVKTDVLARALRTTLNADDRQRLSQAKPRS